MIKLDYLLNKYKIFDEKYGITSENNTLEMKYKVDNKKLVYEDNKLIDKNLDVEFCRIYKDYKNKYFDLKSNIGEEVNLDLINDDLENKYVMVDSILDLNTLGKIKKLKRNVKEKIEIIRYNNDNKKDFFDLREKVLVGWSIRRNSKPFENKKLKYFEELLFKDFNENEYVIAGFYIKDEPVGFCVGYKENEYMSFNLESKIGDIEYKYIGEYIYKYMVSNYSTRFANNENMDIYESKMNLEGIDNFKSSLTNYILLYGYFEVNKKEKNIGDMLRWFN